MTVSFYNYLTLHFWTAWQRAANEYMH